MTDRYFGQTVLWLPLDTDLLDRAPNSQGVSPGPGVALSSAQSRFGGNSCRFTGAGSLSGAQDFTASDCTAPFTFEAWVYFDAGTTAGFTRTFMQWNAVWYVFLDNANGVLRARVGSPAVTLTGPALAEATWYHVALSCDRQTLALFLNGTRVASGTLTADAYPFDYGRILCGGGNTPSTRLIGYMDDVRVTFGTARYLADFTPVQLPAPEFDPSPVPAAVLPSTGTRIAHATPDARVAVPPLRFSPLPNVWFGGTGRIAATVAVKGNPTNTPLRRRVLLMRDRDGVVIRETWSDATTGAYSFDWIDPGERYSAIAQDFTRGYRAVIADNLTPEPMP